jgi:hypothetical protein
LKRLGYEVVELECSASLLKNIRELGPDLVFNLASIYAWEKTDLIPAVLEIGGVCYTGSGMLGLSLARHYTRLYPLLFNAGMRVPPFAVISAGATPAPELRYPLTLLCDGLQEKISLMNVQDLHQALDLFPPDQQVLLQEHMPGPRVSQYILDGSAFPGAVDPLCLAAALKAYELLEARGLARFDFVRSGEPVLEGLEIAPDPLLGKLLESAAVAGWDQERLLEALVQHSGRDISPGV